MAQVYGCKGVALRQRNRKRKQQVEVIGRLRLTYWPVSVVSAGIVGDSTSTAWDPELKRTVKAGNPVKFPQTSYQDNIVVVHDVDTGEQMTTVDNQQQAHAFVRFLGAKAGNPFRVPGFSVVQPKPVAVTS